MTWLSKMRSSMRAFRAAAPSGIRRTGPGWRICRCSMIVLDSSTGTSSSRSRGKLARGHSLVSSAPFCGCSGPSMRKANGVAFS